MLRHPIAGLCIALGSVFFVNTSVYAQCPGDTNGDGAVDPLDAGFVLTRFDCVYPDDGENCLDADVNGDGAVDPLDVGFVQSRFGDCPGISCCIPHDSPGCEDLEVEACVCAVDPFCCGQEWDQDCVEAVDLLQCGNCEGPSNCCSTDHGAGCDDPIIEFCVCTVDPFCCDVIWDANCVAEVDELGCGDCECQEEPPADACECAIVVPIANNETVTYTGDTTGAGQECDELGADLQDVWMGFSIDATDRVFVDYCGTETDFDFLFIVIDNSCPCDGDFIFGTQVTVTCDDATTAAGLRFLSLPAGTYYYPLLAGDLGLDGPYSIRIGRR